MEVVLAMIKDCVEDQLNPSTRSARTMQLFHELSERIQADLSSFPSGDIKTIFLPRLRQLHERVKAFFPTDPEQPTEPHIAEMEGSEGLRYLIALADGIVQDRDVARGGILAFGMSSEDQ